KVEETEIQQEYRGNLTNINDLQKQLQELATEQKRIDREALNLINNQSREIQEVSREIVQLQQQIGENSTIRSPREGCILEITLADGQVVQPGSQLGRLQLANTSETLVGISYFPIKDGKTIEPGMTIQITPDTVKRERFGGIIGKVISVSSFPVTPEAVTLSIGNADVAASLLVPTPELGQDPSQVPTAGAIEVMSELRSSDETFSGWQWSSSRGPQLQMTSGTTVTSRVQVEERAPITFVLPILREWTGIY
ncbi:NHLP bacteriocin system secretion protein, partial [Spirulina sp. 06S082]|uniref:NHLP bacteriocin system secretion protein n=1 Tax=Spirulina sp. 06S082 TaxID=3110248 RepID=UPI002B1FD440